MMTILLMAIGKVYAQPKLNHEEMYIGAHGGVMASMMQFTPTVKQTAKHPFLGANGGLVFRYIGHKVCGLEVEINYMQRGWYESQTGYSRQLDYIEIPLLTHLYFGKKARGFINLGPQLGYCFRNAERGIENIPDAFIAAKNDGKTSSNDLHQYAKIEKPFDWGVAAGLGFYYRSRYAGTYQLEARFNYSLGNIFASTQMDYFPASAHMNLSLNFAYMWQFKGEK